MKVPRAECWTENNGGQERGGRPGGYLLIGVFSSISDRKDLAAPSPESKRLSDQSFSSPASERGSDPPGEAKAILGCLTSPAAPWQATGE